MNMTKAKSKKFVDQVTKGLVKELGAVRKKSSLVESAFVFEVQTKAGKLIINVPKEQELIYMVFARFENVNKANKIFGCNPYSGKFNFSMSAVDAEIAATAFISAYKVTL